MPCKSYTYFNGFIYQLWKIVLYGFSVTIHLWFYLSKFETFNFKSYVTMQCYTSVYIYTYLKKTHYLLWIITRKLNKFQQGIATPRLIDYYYFCGVNLSGMSLINKDFVSTEIYDRHLKRGR